MSAGAGAGVPAGWYPDPDGTGNLRWWDGSGWTDHARTPDGRPTLNAWLNTSPWARRISSTVAVGAGVSMLTAAAIDLSALLRQRPLGGLDGLVALAVPVLVAGQVWAIVVLCGWSAPGSRRWMRGRLTFAQLKPVFTVMPAAVGYGLIGVFFLGWLSAMTAFSKLSRGGPSAPTPGCPWPLFNHGEITCVSHTAYLETGAALQRFAAGILVGFFAAHLLVALAERVRQSHPEIRFDPPR